MVDASPKTKLNDALLKIAARKSPGWCLLAFIALLSLFHVETAFADSIRLRIAWGGGDKVAWIGQVELSEGTFSKSHTLGSEPDAVASAFAQGNHIEIAAPRPLAYQALDITTEAPLTATLNVKFASATDPESAQLFTVPLSDLVNGQFNQPLDAAGNRLLIRRAPGDLLKLTTANDHLVFAPGERWDIAIQPDPNLADRPTVSVRMLVARTNQLIWRTDADVKAPTNEGGPAPDTAIATGKVADVSIPVPRDEGVYDLVIGYGGSRNIGLFRTGAKPVERRVQFIVISPTATAKNEGSAAWREAVSFDAAEPQWWERLSRFPNWQRLAFTPRRLQGKGTAESIEFERKKISRLGPEGWQTYPLPVVGVGNPHILEVEYPGGNPQSLGISIVEVGPDGPSSLQSLDHAIHMGSTSWSSDGKTCRILFWPRSRVPHVLLTNLDDSADAVFGRIRMLEGPRRLPDNDTGAPEHGFRMALASFDDPGFHDAFSASYGIDSDSGRGLTDWATFHQAGKRMVEYLQYAGYGGAMLTCVADGGSICPVPLMDSTARFDTGIYFESGQDAYQKDVVEMLLRMFDREQLRMMLSVRLNAPIPALERMLRDPRQATGILLLDANGNPSNFTNGNGQRYNPLDPRVQQVIIRLLRDLTLRYSRHSSFAGIRIELTPGGFLHLPGAEWGGDPQTLAAFFRETSLEALAGNSRLTLNEILADDQSRAAWLAWRTARISQMFRAMSHELRAARPDANLIVATNRLVDSGLMLAACRPDLPRSSNVSSALISLGIDASALAASTDLMPSLMDVAHPSVDQPLLPLIDRGPLGEFSGDPSWSTIQNANAANSNVSVIDQPPFRFSSQGFDEARIFSGEVTNTPLAFQVVNDGSWRMERLSHQLATDDSRRLVIGGAHTSTIDSDSLTQWLDTYRRLPAKRFADVQPSKQSHPVTVRYLAYGGKTYMYAVNDSPWAVNVQVDVRSGSDCRFVPVRNIGNVGGVNNISDSSEDVDQSQVSMAARVGGIGLQFELQPYGLIAGTLTDSQAVLTQVATNVPSHVAGDLQQMLVNVGTRLSSTKRPIGYNALANPGFDDGDLGSPEEYGPAELPGWEWAQDADVSVKRDATVRYSGTSSLQIESAGPVTWVRSAPIPVPKTGRLSLQAMVRTGGPTTESNAGSTAESNAEVTESNATQPLRLALEGVLNGKPYYRFAELKLSAREVAAAGKEEWSPFLLHIDDLPSGLSELRVRFDLMGKGLVWVDDVRLFDLALTAVEQVQLSKIIGLANYQLREGRVADCERSLRGYWPQYLFSLVPAPVTTAGPRASEPRIATAPAEPKPEPARESATGSMLNRVKGLLRF